MESKERVTDALLDLIRRKRNGETISRKLIRDVTDCYVELGIEEDETPDQVRSAQPNPNAKLKVYMDHFEAKFLRETENYYANEAQAFLEHNPLTEYMKKVLIEAQLELFQNEFGALLEANKDDDLARMYKAATTFINKNEVTSRSTSQQMSKSPELLAKYCDQLLRKSSKMPEENELEDMLTQVMVVFKYIEDKDVFSKFYTKMFSKRLISETSASEEAEVSLINKLKQMCGFEYTNRLSKMINDTQISKVH
ncbi:cullin family protein [Teladorsagia circumcincta]|uniref:Cullin family protein n=1 Tax=Teladorsagia circumcincta TaxID=45464 RepID=A0A2G9UAH7_TELCI|nr:cullin family protein [Teladorsagia circumcincta]